MLRLLLLAVLAVSGCAERPAPVVQNVAPRSDPVLMEAFFGTGEQRGVLPVVRCGVRCQAGR